MLWCIVMGLLEWEPTVMVGHSHVVNCSHSVDAALQCIINGLFARVGIYNRTTGDDGAEGCLWVRRPTQRPTSMARPARSAMAPRPLSPPTAPPPQMASTERAGCRRNGARKRIPPHFRLRSGCEDAVRGCLVAGLCALWGMGSRRDWFLLASGCIAQRRAFCRSETGGGEPRRGSIMRALYWPEDGEHLSAPGGSVSMGCLQPDLVLGMGRAEASSLNDCEEGSQECRLCRWIGAPGEGEGPRAWFKHAP